MRRSPNAPRFRLSTRQEITQRYVERFDERDTLHAENIASSIESTPTPLAQHLVLIPVAAHQEKLQIQPAISEYAKQKTNQPFSIVLGLNSPSSEKNNTEIDALVSEIEAAKMDHPHLDIRTSMTFYDNPTIGMIRRDLWNGALLASLNQGAYTQDDTEIIGINHDIDTVAINPRYIQRVQDYYNRRQRAYDNAGMQSIPLACRSTIIKHAPSDQYPIISKGIYWSDFFHRQINAPYEAGMVFPLSHYADKAGFNVDAVTHETGSLFETVNSHTIPGTTMQTSPRRYIDRLKYGYDKIWTTDSFGARDQCRSQDTPTVDMTLNELEAVITKDTSIRQTVSHIASRAIYDSLLSSPMLTEPHPENDEINDYLFEQKVNQTVNRKLYLTTAVLERVVQSPRLAREARSLYGDTDLVIDVTNHLMGRPD